jgi:2-amino-4-hydroxy-6-hydroxymethyldihydropteridine diphosphokinase
VIIGNGVDIVDISRIDTGIAKRILCEDEVGRKLTKEYVGGRFALKEAFFKALGSGLENNSFKDIEFLDDKRGKPYLVAYKDFDGFNFVHPSLSHDSFAIGTVIIEKVYGKVYLGIGTNMGNREENIRTALDILIEKGIKVIVTSTLYKTKPYGKADQDYFYNIVVEIDSEFSPFKLLEVLQSVENVMGRKRIEKWGPRIIDIDILFFGNLVVKSDHLTIPHYDLVNRDFFVRPMSEMSPQFCHPVEGKNMRQLYKGLKEDSCEVVEGWSLKK